MSTTGCFTRTGARRLIDVTDVPREQVRAYVRERGGAANFHFERRGQRTFLVADGATLADA